MSDIVKTIENLSEKERALFHLLLEERRTKKGTDQIGRVSRNKGINYVPLSFAQQRLWILDQLEPGNPVYNITTAVHLAGPLNRKAVEWSLNKIIERHEILRTSFVFIDEEPAQKILPSLKIVPSLIDLQTLPATEQEALIPGLIAKETARSFDLQKGPLLRATLLVLNQHNYVLLMTMHHIISDGWSLGLILQEMTVFYEAYFVQDKSYSLPPLPVQYADFTVWQRERLTNEIIEKQLTYWRKQIGNQPPILELPANYSRSSKPTFRGGTQLFTLPQSVSQKLKQLSRQENATLFITLLTVLKILLFRYTGQTDITVGTPITNRDQSQIQNLIGFFVNTLILRTDLSGNPEFTEVVERVRRTMSGAHTHRDLPFERLVQELQLERSEGLVSFPQVVFMFQEEPVSIKKFANLTLTPLVVENKTTPFNLILSLTQKRNGQIGGSVRYNLSLFDDITITRFIGHFQTLLENIVDNPNQNLAVLDILTPTERQQLLASGNNTATIPSPQKSIHELFETQAKQTPQAIALGYLAATSPAATTSWLTYATLNARANQVAHYLRSLQVGPEVKVGIYMERSLDMIIAILGILKAEGTYVPLNLTYPPERLSYMMANARITVLLTQEKLAHQLPSHSGQTICLDTEWPHISHYSDTNPVHSITPNNLAYVMYTSGSTGKPKGVSVPHKGVVRLVREANFATFDSWQIFLQFAPISFDAATLEIWGPLLNGGKLAIAPAGRLSLTELGEILQQQQVTTLWLTSALFQQMVDNNLESLGDVQQLLAGGDVLSTAHVHKVVDSLKEILLINGYGPTENTTFTCCYPVKRVAQVGSSVPIGQPIARTQVYILNTYLQPTPVGVTGELYIGGDGLARDYLDQPGLTAKKFIPHPFSSTPGDRLYRSGDQARYLPDGNIEFLGRLDQQVKIRGFRIELGEIETVLGQHPAIKENIVLVREEKAGDKRLVAYVVLKQTASIETETLLDFLRHKLPSYMLPSRFLFLEKLPVTTNGKVDRRALSELSIAKAAKEEGFIPAQTPVEKILAAIWSDILGVEQVGLQDNFFELGGHSLLATQIITRIRDAFQIDISLSRLFEAPTLANLATAVQQAQMRGEAFSLPPIVPILHDKPLPLSFAQQRLWFLDRLQSNTATYSIPAAILLTGELDVGALIKSLSAIEQRHEALRTTFTISSGKPKQVINPASSLTPLILDLQLLPVERQDSAVQRIAASLNRCLFDLARGPLVRVVLLRLARRKHVFLMTMHHIISDGWSMGIFVKEIMALYRAFANGNSSPLPSLSIQYADFAHWQRRWLRGATLEKKLAYWQQYLNGRLPCLNLPTDKPRPPIQTFDGVTYSFTIPPEITDALNAFSRQQHVTLFMTLLAAFKVLLYRYTGQTDIIVGSPIANRNQQELESLIGFFVNTLVLRSNLATLPSFVDFLNQVRKHTLDAYKHQDIPFEKLVEVLQPERDLSRPPIFQVMFSLQNAPVPSLQLPKLSIEPLSLHQGTAKFDLSLLLTEREAEIRGTIEYNTDLFVEETIHRLAEHLQTILSSIIANPQQNVSMLPLLPAHEQQLLKSFNQTTFDYERNQLAHALFEARAAVTPHALAVATEDQQLSYQQLNAQANQLAHYLQFLGVGHDVPVLLYLERSPSLILATLAILKAGGAYVPLDPNLPETRLQFMIHDTNASVLLTQKRLQPKIAHLGVTTISLDEDEPIFSQESTDNLLTQIVPENLAYIIYTSGSTGQPKGVAIPHSGLRNLIAWHQRAYQIVAADRATLIANPAFDASAWEIWPHLTAGATIHIPPTPTAAVPEKLAAWLMGQKITICFLPTPLAETILRQQWPHTTSLRYLLTGGDELRYRPQGHLPFTLVNNYGPTENTVVTTWAPLQETELAKRPPIGQPIDNTQVYLLDANLQRVPFGLPGELYISGESLARGYWQAPGLTAAQFIPNPFSDTPGRRLYRSGDLARYLDNGHLQFLGRVDHQVKVRGYRIELGEIQATLTQHSLVQETLIIVQNHPQKGRQLVAYIIANEPTPTVSELRHFLRTKLPDYMVPSAYVMMTSFPITANGKIDRQALPLPAQTRPQLANTYQAPLGKAQKQLATIWQELLSLNEVGVNDNFFDLGGHSLLVIELQGRLQDTFGQEFPLTELFKRATIAAQAEFLASQDTTPQQTAEKIAANVQARVHRRRLSRQQRRRRQHPKPYLREDKDE